MLSTAAGERVALQAGKQAMGSDLYLYSLTFISIYSTAVPRLQSLFHLFDERALFLARLHSRLESPHRLRRRLILHSSDGPHDCYLAPPGRDQDHRLTLR